MVAAEECSHSFRSSALLVNAIEPFDAGAGKPSRGAANRRFQSEPGVRFVPSGSRPYLLDLQACLLIFAPRKTLPYRMNQSFDII